MTISPSDRLVIGGWLADKEGAGYYRLRLPLDELEQRGHSVVYHPVLPWRPGKRPASHVLVAQRISNRLPSRRWLDAAGDVRRVFEVDDDLFNCDPASARARRYYLRPEVRERFLANIRSADVVTSSTPYLAGVLRDEYKVQAPIHVLPNCVHPSVLDLPAVDQSAPLSIGWWGSDTHRGDFEGLRRPLGRFLRRRNDVHLVMGGADFSPLLNREAEFRPWRSIWNDPCAYMAGLDTQVGLAPLWNTQFNRCKSPLKALEYAARGIVVVASDVEPYRRFVRHGVTGFLVKHDHEWADALEALLGDEQLRIRMAAAARAQAAEWTIDRHAHLWERAYRGGNA